MRARSLLVAVLALAPLPALAYTSVRYSETLAKRVAARLDHASRILVRAPAAEAAWTYVEPDAVASDDESPKPASATSRVVRANVPVHGVRVPADKVLSLANSGQRPSGIPVPARGERPAGLALFGVSGLGVGLQDGDVLTHAGGRPARSVADVVGVVVGSRAHHVSEICGRFWRNGQPWNLVVEQPYVGPKRVAAERASAEPEPSHVARSGS